MQMYDVGMSSLVAQEAFSLARLADAIGRDEAVGERLRERGRYMRDLISQHLWDADRQVFANRLRTSPSTVDVPDTTNGTGNRTTSPVFVQHVTPTSFYPMAIGALPGAATGRTKETAAAARTAAYSDMVRSYLLNSTRFCLSTNGDFAGNDPDRCYWGLPSVSADDPTFMKGTFVYWRGLSWGPMSMLMYWALQQQQEDDDDGVHHHHVGDSDGHACSCMNHSARLGPTQTTRRTDGTATDRACCDDDRRSASSADHVVRTARRSLCRQMDALLMSQWTANRHICENYSPKKDAAECSGTLFYHWGALNGLIGMMEDGYW